MKKHVLDQRLKEYRQRVHDNTTSFTLNSPKLNQEEAQDIIHSLEMRTTYIPLQQPLTVTIKTKDTLIDMHPIIAQLQTSLVPMIYFLKKDGQRLLRIGLSLFSIGMVVLILSEWLAQTLESSTITQEVYAILSWVFIWTGLEKIIFERRSTFLRIKRLKRLFNATYCVDATPES